MENINKFESGVVSWKTFENLHDSTSILFDYIKHMVNSAIGLSDWKTTDLMPFDIIKDLVEHQELRLKDSWESANADKCSKNAKRLWVVSRQKKSPWSYFLKPPGAIKGEPWKTTILILNYHNSRKESNSGK